MCELFAVSASQSIDIGHYLAALIPRGGKTGPHADGWGIACFHNRAANIIKDASPASESDLLALLARDPLVCRSVIGHIRKANPSAYGRSTANTHPFERELCGSSWVYAHNGKIPGIKSIPISSRERYQPIGETDSEHAFCLLMNILASASCAQERVSIRDKAQLITKASAEIAEMGEFNFILSDGEVFYVHSHTSLHMLKQSVFSNGVKQSAIVLATQPLTDDNWQPMEQGRLYVFSGGRELVPVNPQSVKSSQAFGKKPGDIAGRQWLAVKESLHTVTAV